MGKFDKTQAPYFDFGEDELLKQYYQLLAIPGRVAQAREISTLQTLLLGIIKSIGDSVMGNGDIIEGCQVIPSIDKKSITVTSGKIYIDGIVTPLSETVVPIKGVGNEVVGVKVNESIITEEHDTTLRDPAQGFDNFSQAGCNRIKRTLEVVINDPEASTIATLYEGVLGTESVAPSYDAIEKTLARRTYDESGSYIVDGLTVHTESRDSDENSYNIVVESGKAYVLGYELKVPAARRLKNDRSTTTSQVTVNNYVYEDGVSEYQLDTKPHVAKIVYVNGRVQVEEAQFLSTNTDSVLLDKTDVVSLLEVKQGDTTYTIGTSSNNGDCYLLRDGTRYYVKWNGVNSPTPGVTYNVKYSYNTNFVEGDDYELDVREDGSYLVFKDNNVPLSGTNFSIRYNQYLARRDIVYMDQYGVLTILKGSPDEDGFEVAPTVPVNTLAIAQIYNAPNGSPNPEFSFNNIDVLNIGLTRFTMSDIQTIVDKVNQNTYNQAVLSLNEDARQISTINSKKGLLTDPLVDLSRIDLYYNINSDKEVIDPTKPVYDMSIDLTLNVAYLPLKVYEYSITEPESDNTKRYSRLVTLGVNGENVVLSQLNATKSFLINPYSVYPQMPEISVDPAVDSWIDDTIIEVPVSLTNNKLVSTSTRNFYSYSSSGSGNRSSSRTSTSTSVTDTKVGTEVNTYTTESVIAEKSITYMRQIDITVEGINFLEGLDNIKCSFDGVDVPLIPLDGTESGTLSGTLKSNDEGYLKGKFTIPKNIRTGVREVRLYSDTQVDGYINEAYTLFQSSGLHRTIQRTITTVTTVLLHRTVNYNHKTHTTYWFEDVDPVAETFMVDRTTVLKGIDLYFEGKPSTETPVIVEVKEVINGNIGSTIYAQKSLKASQVNVSADSSVATRFNFDDPIVLEPNTFYAFVVKSTSDRYRVWVSELGGTDVLTKQVILKNSYLTGVMMSSSNNNSWTTHQTTDIKFRLIEDVYDKSSTITYKPIEVDNITLIDLAADYVELDGTSVKWFYSIDGGNKFHAISPRDQRELRDIATSIIFKAELSNNSSENLTPFIATDSLLLIGSSYDPSDDGRYYTGVNVVGMDDYSNVTLILNSNTPAGTSVSAYFSHDNGDTITQLKINNSKTKTLDNGWKEVVYEGSIPENGKSKQCRAFIRADSNSTTYTPRFSAIRIVMD